MSHAVGAGSVAERRLAGALRKEKENGSVDEGESDEESSDEEGVSKARIMGKRYVLNAQYCSDWECVKNAREY